MNTKFNSYISCSLTVQIKDEHITELKSMIDKEVISNNRLTLNKAYESAEIFSLEIRQE